MLTKTKIALAAALILGTASAAFANDSGENHQDSDRSVVSSSVAKSANAGAAKAYGFVVSPKQTHRPRRSGTATR
jgi:hypothetical protein